MRKKIIFKILIIILLFISTSCNSSNDENSNFIDNNNAQEVPLLMKAIINEKEYVIHLEDNDTAKSFVNLLPQNLYMKELNGNEKYAYLDSTLITNSTNPKKIIAGDIMLYGNNCLVIFYKSFDTSYSYTKIGHIDNLEDLSSENITIEFVK